MHKIFFVCHILLNIFYQIECEKSSIKCAAKLHTQADENVYQLLTFGTVDRKWPTNQAELKQFCKDDTVYRKSLKNYTEKCLTGLSKQANNLVLYSIVKTNTNICRSKRRADEFIANSKCANAAKRETAKCYRTTIIKYKNVQFMTNHKMKIPSACCIMHQMSECFEKGYEKFPNDCTFKEISGMRRLFESYFTDVMAFFCGDYTEESDKCESVIPLLPTKITKITDKSMMAGTIEMFESIP